MKDQFVIACIDRPDDAPTALAWAAFFAEHLRHKSLAVLHVASDVAGNNNSVPSWLQGIGAPYINLHGQWNTAIEGLPTAFNAILAVTVVDSAAPRHCLAHPKELLRQFGGCKVAYLCVPRGCPPPVEGFASCLTFTHRREGKEKLVWASYLTRFCHSALTIAHPAYRDGDLARRLQNNIRFADKVYAPQNITYRTAILSRTTRTDQAALEEVAPNLLIALTTDTRDRDIVDWLTPRPELSLLRHPSHTPLLLLNPRDDLYILCD